MNDTAYYKKLVERYVAKKASEEELAVFFQLVNKGKLDEYLNDAFGKDDTISLGKKTSPVKQLAGWKKFAVAASVIVLLTAGAFVFFKNSRRLNDNDPTLVSSTSSAYDQLVTSRGKHQQLILPDGTKIWLNAASSIRYPKQFTGAERTVELNGECYFEVAHDPSGPFHVKLNNGVDIVVTGTHFNVYAYNNEPIKATLLEGRIKVQSKNDSATLHPGEQASVQKAGKLNISRADIQEALAWKNGLLQFNGADVPSVMRQIERWYDVDVVYEDNIPDRQLSGKIPANTNINDVLRILELSNVHCRIEGRKVTVLR